MVEDALKCMDCYAALLGTRYPWGEGQGSCPEEWTLEGIGEPVVQPVITDGWLGCRELIRKQDSK